VDSALQINDEDRDGQTWTTVFKTVQEGIDSAETAVAGSGLTACEVWVAQGEYNIYGNALSTISLKPGVHVYGSFVAETLSRDMRGDWQKHKTILNGQRDGERVYHVVTGADGATLDGFVITGGNANSPVPDDNVNKSGGGMINDAASLTVRNCIFEQNMAFILGGAMYNTNSSDVTVRNCTFVDNEANMGGAVFNDASSVMFNNCTFLSNYASLSGGAMYNSNSSPPISNSVFVENEAGQKGGAILNFNRSYAEIVNCTVFGNTAGSGSAAIDNGHYDLDSGSGSHSSIIGSIVWGNTPGPIVNSSESFSDIDYSNFDGNCEVAEGNNCDANTIHEDPLFKDDGVELMPDSPCIDQADGWRAPLTDIMGNGRYDDPNVANATNCSGEVLDVCVGHADMGAYEYLGP